jgi:hemerythrin-like domain-containing protein
MLATDFLKTQHREAMAMIEMLEKKDGAMLEGASLKLFGKLKSALVFHTTVEEQIFYHTLANEPLTEELVDESYAEHRTVDELLVALSVPTEKWKHLLGRLKREIAHHVDEEENDLFPRAEQILGKRKLQDMGWQMEQIKKGKSANLGEPYRA